MRSHATKLALMAGAAFTAAAFSPAAHAAEPLDVVATFSILGDMTEVVGGDRVSVTTLVGPGGDLHVFQPTPRQAGALADADVVVMNGLALEGWLERLIEAADYRGPIIEAAHDVTPIHAGEDAHEHDAHHAGAGHAEADHEDARPDHAEAGEHEDHDADEPSGDERHAAPDDDHAEHAEADHDEHGHHHHGVYDPHAWQDIANAVLYVNAIADGLSAADPEGAETYHANAAAYVAELEALDAEAKRAFTAVPVDKRTVLTNHDAFAYLAQAYDLEFVAPQGLSTEAEPSARDVADLIRQIREDGIDAVFLESVADNRLVEQIAAETGIRVGGELYSDALSGPDGEGATYLEMMRHNIETLAGALGSGV